MDKLRLIESSFKKNINSVKTVHELDQLYVYYLGRNGEINNLLKHLKSLPKAELKLYGQRVNQLKKRVENILNKKRKEIIQHSKLKFFIDPTLPSNYYPLGSSHIISYVIDEISDIFKSLGFIRMSYREVEYEYFTFDSLNMPKNHPARDDFETFFVNAPLHEKYGKMLLSMHTSSCQVREMWRTKPPIKMINIAKCYRPNWDVSHTPQFHQFESLCIDSKINMTNLKGTIEYFIRSFFDAKRAIRFRPHHFQFTEPSFEIDISCNLCDGKGYLDKNIKCRMCKSGWLELAGAGMVHPNVLKEGRIDTGKYSGWAFAFGIERIAIMKHGLNLDDLRILYSGDIDFLDQF